MRLITLFLLVQATYCLVCPDEYILVNGNKCLRVSWKKVSHLEAEKSCTSDGGTLVTVKSSEENEAVRKFANDVGIFTFWIGLYCPDFNNTSTCLWDNGSGSTASYRNFRMDRYYPSEWSKCVAMQISEGDYYGTDNGMVIDMDIENDGKWLVVGCSYPYNFDERQYICEVLPSNAPHAGSKWMTNYDKYTYLRSPQMYMFAEPIETFESAITACTFWGINGGGKLASIHSKMENDFISGSYEGTEVSRVFIGAQRGQDGRFTWLDGSDWDFEYFDPLDTNEGDCVVMDVQDHGLWRRTHCDQALHYHCKHFNMDPENELPVSNIITPPLPDLSLSNCNSTLLIGPGSISTLGFPSVPQSFCTWNIMVLGAYQVGLFFDKWETSGIVKIYDEFGAQVAVHGGQFSTTSFSEIVPCNSVKVTFQPGAGSGGNVDNGFHAVILPI